jgi:hypothetical protein
MTNLYVNGFLDLPYDVDSRYMIDGEICIIARLMSNRAAHLAYHRNTHEMTLHYDTSDKIFHSILSCLPDETKTRLLAEMTPSKSVSEGNIVKYKNANYVVVRCFHGDLVLVRDGLQLKLLHATDLVALAQASEGKFILVKVEDWTDAWNQVKREWRGRTNIGITLEIPVIHVTIPVRSLYKQCAVCRTPSTTKCGRCGVRHCPSCWAKGHACAECAACSRPGAMKCSCRKARYCSAKCQLSHWSEHKEGCAYRK